MKQYTDLDIDYYEKYFQIIVPILDGHNPNMKEDFESFDKIVSELENYLINNHGNDIYKTNYNYYDQLK